MVKVKRSEYIIISKAILRKLYKEGCWGKGSLYGDNVKGGFPSEDKGKVIIVLEALVRQNILGKKRKKFRFKYYLNPERREKIREIIGIIGIEQI